MTQSSAAAQLRKDCLGTRRLVCDKSMMYRHALLIAFGLLLVTRPCGAYVMDSNVLMRFLVEARRQTPKAVSLIVNEDITGRDHPVEARLFFKRPERMRLIEQDDKVSLTVVKEGRAAIGDDKVLAPALASLGLFATLLFPRTGDIDDVSVHQVAFLKSLGIDPQIVSLALMDETVVYIIGAEAWQQEQPQLWLDKTSYLPVRIRLSVQDPNTRQTHWQELRYQEYGGGAVSGMPRIIEEYLDGTLQRRTELTGGQVARDLPETMFDLTRPVPTRRR